MRVSRRRRRRRRKQTTETFLRFYPLNALAARRRVRIRIGIIPSIVDGLMPLASPAVSCASIDIADNTLFHMLLHRCVNIICVFFRRTFHFSPRVYISFDSVSPLRRPHRIRQDPCDGMDANESVFLSFVSGLLSRNRHRCIDLGMCRAALWNHFSRERRRKASGSLQHLCSVFRHQRVRIYSNIAREFRFPKQKLHFIHRQQSTSRGFPAIHSTRRRTTSFCLRLCVCGDARK